MKRLLKIFASEFWKNKVLKISYIVFTLMIFGIQLYSFIAGFIEKEAFLSLQFTLMFSLFYLIYYMFIGYEYFSSTRASHFEECAGGIHLGLAKIYGSKLLILIGLVLIPFLVFLGFQIGDVLRSSGDSAYLLHVIAHLCLNLFLLPLIGILAGAALSLFANRLLAYLLLFLLVLGFSPFMDQVITSIHMSTGVDLSSALRLFSVTTPSVTWTVPPQYGFSLRPYRIFILLFWIFGLTSFFLYRLSRYQKRPVFRSLMAVALALCIGCVPFAIRSNSDVVKDINKVNGVLQDVDYYSKETKSTISHDGDPSFQITKYKMDLTVDRMLHANVTVSVDQPTLDRYLFTLYHGYKVKQVLSRDGASLSFTQEGDLVEVARGTENAMETITFVYEGYSPIFYSNSQGMFLPGYFAFYPHSGAHDLFDVEAGQFNRTILERPVTFEVTVNTAKTCYTNLDQNGRNHFSGSTTGLTLLSGFINETEVGSTKVVKAYLEESDDEVKAHPPAYLREHPYKKVMVIPNINMDYYLWCVDFGDYLLVPTFKNSDLDYETRNIPRCKWQLFVITNLYQDSRESYDEQVKYDRVNTDDKTESLFLLFDQKLHTLGEKKILSLCKTYLNDEKDTRTMQEFLNQI